MVKNYTVVYRLARWWIFQDAERWGPFDSSSLAEASAIHQAKIEVRSGHEARVHVDHPDYRLAYDSSSIDAVRRYASGPLLI